MMASTVFVYILFLGGLHAFVAAPTMDRLYLTPTLMSWSGELEHTFSFPNGQNTLANIHINNVDSLLLAPPDEPNATPTTTERESNSLPYPFSFSYMTSSPPASSIESIATVTVTEDHSTTIMISATPSTVTDTITVTYTASPITSSTEAPLPSPGGSPGETAPTKAKWKAPKDLTNLDAFRVSKFAAGEKNVKIVAGIPAEASATPSLSSSESKEDKNVKPSLVQWDNSSSILQVLYPEGSIDPAKKPQGGADFYASPIDISDAINVTLTYSVFFPMDFDWVLAGKLPGLYGGHTGCSGGNAALDCFSTRLMWRPDGDGELYLYAPKDKQTKSLCDDPQSVCDASYGLSVGRGAFKWGAGVWTTVEQTIALNTPGKQDGSFTLVVNGERKVDRNDVYYRGDMSGEKSSPKTTHEPSKMTTTKKSRPSSTVTSTSTYDGGPLGPILGGIIGGLGLRRVGERGEIVLTDETFPGPTSTPPIGVNDTNTYSRTVAAPSPLNLFTQPISLTPRPSTLGMDVGETKIDNTDDSERAARTESATKTSEEQVKLIGIFFSTFFGGHEDKYATPRDQYAWFKDFALSYNS